MERGLINRTVTAQSFVKTEGQSRKVDEWKTLREQSDNRRLELPFWDTIRNPEKFFRTSRLGGLVGGVNAREKVRRVQRAGATP